MFRRLRIKLLGNRRYRDAAYARPNISRRTEASWSDRLRWVLSSRDTAAYDEGERRLGDGLRLVLVWGGSFGLLWFLARSVMALNIFAGN